MLGEPMTRPEVTAALTAVIEGLGGAGHVERLIDLIGALVLHDRVTVVRYSATEAPEFVSWRNYSPEMVRKYLETYYVFDPFYADWRLRRRPGVVGLRNAPQGKVAPYITEFLGESQICDEIGVMLEDGGDWCLGIFLDRSRHRYTAAERERLERRFPVFEALHRQDLRFRGPGFRRTSGAARQGREPRPPGEIGAPGGLWPELTSREREVVAMILSGYPGSTIAERLGISAGTVKNHRRNVYQKLDITTERELFLQYIQSLDV